MEKQEKSVFVDYITVTFEASVSVMVRNGFIDEDSVARYLFDTFGILASDFKYKGSVPFYQKSFMSQNGVKFDLNPLGSTQKSRLILSGSFWSQVVNHPLTVQRLLNHGAKVTRIDLRYDYRAGESRVSGYANDWQKVYKGREVVTGLVGSSSGGWTFYIGSRSSVRFARVYEKWKESPAAGYDRGTFRFECEFKDVFAQSVAELVAGGMDNANRVFLETFKSDGVPVFEAMASELWQSNTRITMKRKATDREVWLFNTVLSSLVNWAGNDDSLLIEFLESARLLREKKQARESASKGWQLSMFTD